MIVRGQRFGRLVAVGPDHRDSRGVQHWLCSCDCGEVRVVRLDNLKAGMTRSCGCLRQHPQANRMRTIAVEEHW